MRYVVSVCASIQSEHEAVVFSKGSLFNEPESGSLGESVGARISPGTFEVFGGALLRQGVVPPKPAEGIGENRAAVVPVMGAFSVNKFYVVVPKQKGRVHLFVAEGPVAVLVVEIVAAVLHENAERLFLAAFPN